jgi:hypothetical protein
MTNGYLSSEDFFSTTSAKGDTGSMGGNRSGRILKMIMA